MFDYDFDFTGVKKIVVMLGAGLFVVWMHEISGIAMWFLAVWYCCESHKYYVSGYKPYRSLGGHLRKAVR